MLLCMGAVMKCFASTLAKILMVTSQFGGVPRSFWADRLGLRHDGCAEEALRIHQAVFPSAVLLLKLTPWRKPTTVSSSPCKQV